MKRTPFAISALFAAATITVGAVYARRSDDVPALTTETVTRGNIVNVVSATGTLQAVTMVQVGSQVSGTVEALNADFNDIVKKGAAPCHARPVHLSQRSRAGRRRAGQRAGGSRAPEGRRGRG